MYNARKKEIRFKLLLELNSCFSNVSAHFVQNGDEDDRAFLAELIKSIKSCVIDETHEAGSSEFLLDPPLAELTSAQA